MESLEVSAKSVDEAIESALQQLGAKLSEVEIIILSKGRAGILGVGAEDARIRVTKIDVGRSRMSVANFPPRPPAISYAPEGARAPTEDDDEDEDQAPRETRPQPGTRDSERQRRYRGPAPAAERRDDEPDGTRAQPRPRDHDRQGPYRSSATAEGGAPPGAGKDVLEGLLDHMGFHVDIVAVDPPTTSATGGPVAAYDIRGDDLGVLIGRRGQTLSSLQYLINLMVNRRLRNPVALVVDVEGYRARRYQSLRGLAQRMADRVRSTGQSVTLEPMNAAERRIIHLALQDHRDVGTQSVGEGDGRKVSIVLRKGGRPDRQ